MTLPSANELQYFLEISQTLNISRAAERLGITQPTLSLAIQRLEHSFGVPLLLRGKSGVRLTRAGQKFVSQARSLLDEWERVREAALADETEVRGRFTIGCHASVGCWALPQILAPLMREHAALEIGLVHDLSRRITEAVVSYQVDFGIVVNPVEHPDLVIQELCRDEVSLWKAKKGATLDDVLICDLDLLQTQSLLRQLKKDGHHFARTISTSSLEAIAALVAGGAGIGILPNRVAERQPGIEKLASGGPVFKDRICLVYRVDAQKSRAAKKIVEGVRKFS